MSARFDAVVVGAGVSGLMAATVLNARGRRVLVLEHNHQPGGLMAGIRRQGFYFDVGCQSFENMGMVFPLLEQHGLGGVAKFKRARYRLMMPGLDTVIESLAQAREDFKLAYPAVARNLDEVFDQHDSTSKLVRALFKPEAIPYVHKESAAAFLPWLARALPWLPQLKTLMLGDFTRWYERRLPPGAGSPGALLANCGYTRMNVFVASAFWHLWAEDYWYPEGGFQAWFDRWVAALEARGVEFLFQRSVTGIEKKGARAEAVLTRKGDRFETDSVVYTGDYKQGVELVGRELYARSTLAALDEAGHSDALVSVYLGLNIPAAELKEKLKTAHTMYFPSEVCAEKLRLDDPDAHRKSFIEVTAHCVDDEALNPPGKSSLVVQAFTDYKWLDGWRAGDQPVAPGEVRRPAEYKDLKKRVAEHLIGTLEGLLPGVREKIEYCDVGTPLSTTRFTRNHLGGTCGFELNWLNYPFWNPLAHTTSPLENVHMAGHFTVWPGAVPTAALSGKIAALRALR